MKEYRLVAWPQLRAPFDRIAHRRMLSDMSHRHMTVAQLIECSGMRRSARPPLPIRSSVRCAHWAAGCAGPWPPPTSTDRQVSGAPTPLAKRDDPHHAA